jgi:hypothetical protein
VKDTTGLDFSLDPEYEKAAGDVFSLLGPYLLRRGKLAKNPDGSRILPLGKLRESIANVELRDDEIDDINKVLETASEARVAIWGSQRAYK